ncbi:NADP-dependent oxidoreductase domain-containing protein, partial [Cyathus striatus]
MTVMPTSVPDELCFESIKSGIDTLLDGAKMVLNSSEFYGHNPLTANLKLLARFFDKYPTHADKVFLSVKGGFNWPNLRPDTSPEFLRRSVENINAALHGTKRLDLFECARVDHDYEIEDTMRELVKLIKEGKFDHIGMSECKAEAIKRAHVVSAIYPVALVEIEVSPWVYRKEGRDVIRTCKELGISIAAYSPLGQGMLTGKITKFDDLESFDYCRRFKRF